MPKKTNLYNEILSLLKENIIPSIITSLKEMGMDYAHTIMLPGHSMAFFNHINIPFPFLLDDLARITDDKGVEQRVVVFNIRQDGQISIAMNVENNAAGIAILRNPIIIADNYLSLFDNLIWDNTCLFHVSQELTARAKTLEADKEVLSNLLKLMSDIKPKYTRNVLMEKK